MRYQIWRGQAEIGGMCVEVAADDGTRILLDLGMPLLAPGGGESRATHRSARPRSSSPTPSRVYIENGGP